MPTDIAVDKLDDEQMRDLNRLKAWIYRQRTRIRLERDRAEWHQRKEEEAQLKKEPQPALFDF